MKKSLFFLISFLFLIHCSNAQSFAWAKRCGLWAFDLGYGIGTDASGNVYIAGKYEMNKAVFGTTTVPCAGNHDIYLAKYNSNGDFQWVRTAGGPGGDYAHCLAVDAAGNSYIAGEMEQTIHFAGTNVSLTTNGSNDVFIAKYNSSGTLIWARKMGGGSQSDKGLGICLSGSNVYITGNFAGTANFAGTSLTSYGGHDIFIGKYTTDGVFQWVRKAGSSGDDEGYAVTGDSAGNCYVTGYFRGTANFSNTFLTSRGQSDIFIAKYNSAGSIVWARKAGGSSSDYGMAIKIDSSGRLFVTGGFRVKSFFEALTLTAEKGDADIFVARYDANGNAVWIKKAGGLINDYGRGLALDASSNVYITGNYGLAATFDTSVITGVDTNEVYFASYDAGGNFRWVLKVGGDIDKSDPGRFIEMGLSIATDPSGNVYGSGTYRSRSTFGSTTLNPWDHTEIFVTKIVQSSSHRKGALQPPVIIPSDSTSFCSGGSATLKTEQDSGKKYVWIRDGAVINNATANSYKATMPGKYMVMTIKDDDTLISATTKVKVTQKIVAQINTPGKVFCKDSNTVLTANAGEDYRYYWKRNGWTISGANSQIFQPQKSGDYQVKIIQGSCFDWSPVTHIEMKRCSVVDTTNEKNSSTEINANEAKDDSVLVNIYPNPNNGLFTLEINMQHVNETAKEVKVEVINSIGQIVYSKMVICEKGQMEHHIELGSSVPVGIYILHLSMGDKIEKNRLMLVR